VKMPLPPSAPPPRGSAMLFLAGTMVAVAGAAHAAARAPDTRAKALKIGVYDVTRARGQGAPVREIVRGLAKRGWQVESFVDLHLITLLQYDIVYLSDMHRPGNSPKDGPRNIAAYLAAGGSVLQTWHHHILSRISIGVRRVYGKRSMKVVPGHPAVAGITDFKAAFRDHIIEKVGSQGTVVIRNGDGQPVAVVGTIGKGKVVSTGLSLDLPRVNPVELKLTEAFFRWLAPDVPRQERMRVLSGPELMVFPETTTAPAGLPTAFRLVTGPVEPGQTVEMRLDGRSLTPRPVAPGSILRQADFRLTAPPGRDSEAGHELTVKLGNTVLKKELKLRGLFAPPPPEERRGVWLHVGKDRRPAVVMPELRKLGINMAVLRIAGGTAAFYGSKVQPDVQDPMAAEGGDWLAAAVKYAHANGIELHAYVNNCVVEGRTSPASLRRLRAQGRLQEGPDGQPIDWFCPSQPENVEAITRPMVEIAANYDVDGVQYDFIRYPNRQGCYCAKCRALFEKESGAPVKSWPADVLEGGPRAAAYVEFRCERISAIVRHVSAAVRRANPKVKISAAVFRDWPDCRENVGQDWVRWCREGWLDFVCPMTYTLDPVLYESLVESHRAAVPPGFPIVEGIGIASSSGTMEDPAQVALHVILARKAGAAGFCGFCYKPRATRRLLAPLRAWFDASAGPAQQ